MRALSVLLHVFLSDARRHPGTSLAALGAITAGVAVFVGILQAGGAARSSFVSTVEAVAGRTTHQVVRAGGVDERRLAHYRSQPEVEAAQPVVEGLVRVLKVHRRAESSGQTLAPLRLMGIDPFSVAPFFSSAGGGPTIRQEHVDDFLTRPGTVVLPEPWAVEAGVQAGDAVEVAVAGRSQMLSVLGTYALDVLGEAARDTALVDIATAQEVLLRVGTLDRIDLIVSEGSAVRLEEKLAPGEQLERPTNRGERVAKMIDAFRLNLAALGGLALVVGAILVYNAAQFSVVRRVPLLGQLRCLGVSRATMIAGVLLEVALLGAVGGVLGCAAGRWISRALASAVAQTVTDLYEFVRVEITTLDPSIALLVVLGAAGVATAAGWFPAFDAARTAPKMVGLRSRGEQRFRGQIPRLLLIGAIGIVVGVSALIVDSEDWWVGLVAAFAFLFAGASLLPVVMAGVLRCLENGGEALGWITLAMSAGALRRSLSRTGGAASALGVALSMTLGVIVMVASFESEVRRWISATLTADVFLADDGGISRLRSRLPDKIVDEIRGLTGVAHVDTLRAVEVPFRDRSLFFGGAELPPPVQRDRFEFLGTNSQIALRKFREGQVLISEPLANRYKLTPGAFLTVTTRNGPEAFEIAGVFRDFSFDRGYALANRARFLEAFGDPGVRNVALYLESGVSAAAFAESLRTRFAGRFLVRVRSNAELRDSILRVFQRTFRVTYLLQVIATMMALAGIAVTLFGLFLERSWEVATLRALGASFGQLMRLFTMESVVLTLFPIGLAFPLGAVLAGILIYVVNLRSFGWTIGFLWPWGAVLMTCGLALLAGLVATAIPGLSARRQSIAEALREE